jgi:alpha-N-acetylglucosamine transferase
LTNYTRVIYLDSDGIVLNNMDHLFLAPQARIALRM